VAGMNFEILDKMQFIIYLSVCSRTT